MNIDTKSLTNISKFNPAVYKKIIAVVLVSQSCLILCDPMDYSPPGSSVQVILQARILEWVPFPSPGDCPNPGTEPGLQHCRWILYHLSHQGSLT